MALKSQVGLAVTLTTVFICHSLGRACLPVQTVLHAWHIWEKNVAAKDWLTEGSEVPAGTRGGSSVTLQRWGKAERLGRSQTLSTLVFILKTDGRAEGLKWGAKGSGLQGFQENHGLDFLSHETLSSFSEWYKLLAIPPPRNLYNDGAPHWLHLRIICGTYKTNIPRWWLFSLQVMSDSATPWTATRQASLSLTISWSLPKFMSIELVMPSNHLILCRPLLLLPLICPSIRVFSNELALPSRWAKYWSFSFGISPSNEYSGLISFRIEDS